MAMFSMSSARVVGIVWVGSSLMGMFVVCCMRFMSLPPCGFIMFLFSFLFSRGSQVPVVGL